MSWLAIDPEGTEKRRIPDEDGLLVELGYWPPRIEVRLRPRLAGLSIYRDGAALDPRLPADMEALVALNEIDLEVYREAARWSVRGWEGEPAAVVEPTVVDGRTHQKLSDASLDRLFRNRLLFAVAQYAIAFNVLTEEKKRQSEI